MVRSRRKIKESEQEGVVVENGGRTVRRAILFLSGINLLLSFLFLSRNIAGNVTRNFSSNDAIWIGGVFFVIAIIGFLVYVRCRK